MTDVNLEFKKVIIELMNIRSNLYEDLYTFDIDKEEIVLKDNVECLGKIDNSEEHTFIIKVKCHKVVHENSKTINLPVSISITDNYKFSLFIILTGIFNIVSGIPNDNINSISEEQLLKYIWPYICESVYSITAKMDIDSPIRLPMLEKVVKSNVD